MTSVRKVRARTLYYLTLDDGTEVEVQHEPCDWMDVLSERVGNKLVVAYLVHDDDPQNPMTERGDASGTLYTFYDDEDRALYNALGLTSYGEPDIDREFELDGVKTTLRELAESAFFRHQPGGATEQDLDEHLGEVEANALDLYQQHWRAIAGPYVVPVDYCASNHGPGTTSCSVTTWDGDIDGLPSGVWVADEGAIDNIKFAALPAGIEIKHHGSGSENDPHHVVVTLNGTIVCDTPSWPDALDFVRQQYGEATFDDLVRKAEEYAAPILEEYAEWCNGNVYGCVIEEFELQGDDWVQTSEDACWGFIGSDWAQRALREEYFDYAVLALRKGV